MIIVLLTYYMNISEGKRLIKNIHNFKNVYDKGLYYLRNDIAFEVNLFFIEREEWRERFDDENIEYIL